MCAFSYYRLAQASYCRRMQSRHIVISQRWLIVLSCERSYRLATKQNQTKVNISFCRCPSVKQDIWFARRKNMCASLGLDLFELCKRDPMDVGWNCTAWDRPSAKSSRSNDAMTFHYLQCVCYAGPGYFKELWLRMESSYVIVTLSIQAFCGSKKRDWSTRRVQHTCFKTFFPSYLY